MRQGQPHDAMLAEILSAALADTHVAESVRLVQAASLVVPIPPVVQSQATGSNASTN